MEDVVLGLWADGMICLKALLGGFLSRVWLCLESGGEGSASQAVGAGPLGEMLEGRAPRVIV